MILWYKKLKYKQNTKQYLATFELHRPLFKRSLGNREKQMVWPFAFFI